MRVEVADALVAQSLSEEWDVILLAAVLEHLYEPMPVLRRVRDALRPGGLVYIDVPNECALYTRVGNLYQRLRGRDWAVNLSPTFPPFHVVGFCPESLKRALQTAGLRDGERRSVLDGELHGESHGGRLRPPSSVWPRERF